MNRRGRPGRPPPYKPGRKAHNCYRSRRAGGVSPVDAALPPVGHLHDAPPTAPVHPTATCRVVARADRRCSRRSPVRYVTAQQSSCGVDEHGAAGALPGAAEGWRAEEWRDELRRESCRSCGHVFSGRTSPPGGSLWSGARRGTRRAPGPKVGVGVDLGRAARPPPRPWWAAIAFPKSPRTRHHALHAEPSPPACRRRLTPTPTGSRPARHPESGGLPRPVGRRGRPGRPVQAGPPRPGRAARPITAI